MNKYKACGKGWWNESYRHSLAAKGIKTSFAITRSDVLALKKAGWDDKAIASAKETQKAEKEYVPADVYDVVVHNKEFWSGVGKYYSKLKGVPEDVVGYDKYEYFDERLFSDPDYKYAAFMVMKNNWNKYVDLLYERLKAPKVIKGSKGEMLEMSRYKPVTRKEAEEFLSRYVETELIPGARKSRFWGNEKI